MEIRIVVTDKENSPLNIREIPFTKLKVGYLPLNICKAIREAYKFKQEDPTRKVILDWVER